MDPYQPYSPAKTIAVVKNQVVGVLLTE